MQEAIYVLDANVFIEASRRYYAFDLAPGFWDNLIRLANADLIKSIDHIKRELDKGKDELAAWVNHHFHHAFDSTNQSSIVRAYREIIKWVDSQSQFSDAARADFASGADGWLVAYAKVYDGIVVTHEVAAPESKIKVPIPNICVAFNIQFIDTFEMLRALGVILR